MTPVVVNYDTYYNAYYTAQVDARFIEINYNHLYCAPAGSSPRELKFMRQADLTYVLGANGCLLHKQLSFKR